MPNEEWPDDPLIREILQQEWSGEAARRPFLKAFSLWAMALSENPTAGDFPLELIVTRESFKSWDLDQIARETGELAVYSGVDYLSPEWARVLLVRPTGESRRLAQDEPTTSPLAFYVRFVEEVGDWRVHLIGPPNLSVEDLP